MDDFKIKDGRSLPFFQVDNRLIDDCNLDTSSKLIYVALCRYSNNGSKAFPSINVLAEKCGMSASTVKRRLNELEQNKYIKRVNRASENGSKTSNLYIVSDIPYGSERPIPMVRETHTHRSAGPIPMVTVTHNKEQVIKNNIKNNNLSCCSLDEVPTNTVDDLENIESTNSTNNEQTIINDLQSLNIPTTSFVVETVREWTEEHDVELLQAVIDKCVSTATNGVNLNYLKKAVDRLTTQGIKTLADLERAEELRAKQRGSKYGKQQRVEVMPKWEAPTEVEQTPESERELAMIKYLMGEGLHPETGEMNPSPLS